MKAHQSGSSQSPAASSSATSVGIVAGQVLKLTQTTYRRLVEPGQPHDIPDRKPLIDEPLDGGSGCYLSHRHIPLSLGPSLPGNLDIDRGLVDALLSR
ncbi:hypothetical protein [Nocardioides allogilvus]|uniref:hypothetical protein n=1 Tax=Nocardioides allogilvus TaxID=2072017 RepID=UPI00130067AC|nr:hypothetical protein [Nocardioides allogilvus]